MKWSIYNELITIPNRNGVVYFFNCLRNTLISLDNRLEYLITKHKTDPSLIEDIHPELYSSLLAEKFIIPDHVDESIECINEIEQKFTSDELLRITVNPTLDCNLRCWYCYENHIKGSCMSHDTIQHIVKFVEKSATSTTLKKIQLSFFGGEPLLKYNNVVKPLAELCRGICIKHQKKFMLSLTTNGVCLTPKVINELKTFSAEVSVQVAFDGNRKIHDKIKCFPNGEGCYEMVKRQLINTIQNGFLTTIRCNYTLSNLDSFYELIDDFQEYWQYPNVRFSFHKVWQEPDSPELHAKRNKLKKKIEDIKIQSNIESYFGDSISPCYGDFDKNFVFNYNGDVYKCTARDFKPENRIGYLSTTGDIIFNENAEKRNKHKLTNQCYQCRLLPICTICFQQRYESHDSKCPIPAAKENATENIKKYFYDIINLQINPSKI